MQVVHARNCSYTCYTADKGYCAIVFQLILCAKSYVELYSSCMITIIKFHWGNIILCLLALVFSHCLKVEDNFKV